MMCAVQPVMRDITNSGVNYATAVTMPYAEVLTAAKETRYDIDVVSARFGTGFESTCQRLGAPAAARCEGGAVRVHPHRPRRQCVQTPGHRGVPLLAFGRDVPVVGGAPRL